MFSSNCCLLTWIQISQESDQVAWYSHLLKNFPQFVVIHTVKGSSIVNEAKVDVFLEFSYFFYNKTDVGNLISGSFVFSKSSLNIWKISVHVLLNPRLENFRHYFSRVLDECNCVFEHSLALPFLRLEWKLTFSSPVTTAELSSFADILSAALSQHHLLGFEIAQLEFHHLH